MDLEQFRSKIHADAVNSEGKKMMSATRTRLSGEVRVNGAGEVSADIIFPMKFIEKPTITFGGEILEGDAVVDGFMPTVSVVVLGWITEERPPTSRFYIGANLGIVISGVNYQKLSVHWSLEGVALTNPV